MDRLPGRLEDGARLLGRLRPQAQRPLRLPAALRDLPARPARLAPALAGRQPRPARPARLRRLPLLLQPGRDRRLGAARLPAPPLPASARALWIGAPRPGRGAAPGLAGDLAAGRRPLPDRRSGSASTSPTRARSTSATPASSAPTGSPTANRSTTTSPRTSRRATPTARSTTSPTSPSRRSGPGRAPGTTCPPPTAPPSSSTSPPSPCCSCSAAASAPARPAARSPRPSPSAGPPSPTPPTCSSRTPTTPWSALLLVAILLVLARPVARGVAGGAGDPHQVRPASCSSRCSLTYAARPAARLVAFGPRLPRLDGCSGDAVARARPRPRTRSTTARSPTRPDRDSPFSIWGQVDGAGAPAHRDPRRQSAALALALAFRPRDKTLPRSQPWARRC